MHAFMEDDEDRNATQSARLRRICSGTDDDQPEDLILQYLNQSHPVAGRGRTPREPSGGIALSARTDDRMDTQSARMRRMCTGTDDDEPEAVLLELLNAQSCQKGHAVGPPRSRGAPGAPEDLDSMAYVTVSDDWDSESNKMEEQEGRSVRPGSLYSSPVGHRSMLSMQARAEPSPTLLKTSSLYNVQTTPTRGFRKFSDTPEPCSPGLLPSAKKQSYSFGDEAAEEWGDPDDPGPETNREFAYVDSLFSKIRHNRTGYVAAELEKGCDPAMKVRWLSLC